MNLCWTYAWEERGRGVISVSNVSLIKVDIADGGEKERKRRKYGGQRVKVWWGEWKGRSDPWFVFLYIFFLLFLYCLPSLSCLFLLHTVLQSLLSVSIPSSCCSLLSFLSFPPLLLPSTRSLHLIFSTLSSFLCPSSCLFHMHRHTKNNALHSICEAVPLT